MNQKELEDKISRKLVLDEEIHFQGKGGFPNIWMVKVSPREVHPAIHFGMVEVMLSLKELCEVAEQFKKLEEWAAK